MTIKLRTLKGFFDSMEYYPLQAGLLKVMDHYNIRKNILKIDTNNVCNIDCIMCHNKFIREIDKPVMKVENHFMSIEDFIEIIDGFSKNVHRLYLSYCFEPLLTPDFKKYLSYAKSKGIPFISFSTNGLLLDDDMAAFLVDNRFNEVSIFLNGYDKHEYNRVMCGSDFEAVMENIKRVKRHREKKSAELPKIKIETVLMRTNLINFNKLTGIVRDYGVEKVQFYELNNDEHFRKSVSGIENEMIDNMDKDEMKSIAESIAIYSRELEKTGKRLFMPMELPVGEPGSEKHTGIGQKNVVKRTCFIMPSLSLWISSKGLIKVCCSKQSFVLGNVLTDCEEMLRNKLSHFQEFALYGRCMYNCKYRNNFSTDVL